MFYGYDSESQLREDNPKRADHLISIAEQRTVTVCSREKQCTGTIDGKEYTYADGSKDFGTQVTAHCARFKEDVFQWHQEACS